MTPLERFWTYVDKDGPKPTHVSGLGSCWLWTGGRSKKGYGIFRLNGTMQYAHRISFSLKYGQVPRSRKICHKCDNPPCCNPDHLFQGTDRDNLIDSINKGRRLVGEEHWMARLTEAQVKEVRKLHSEGLTQVKIAAKMGVNQSTVQRILTGKSWAHVA